MTAPIADVPVPPCVELLRAVVTAEGEVLGTVELPVIGGRVPAAVLADAVAADHAWEILRRFLAPRAPGRFGWDLFLQELWGRPGWPMSTFYDPAAVREEASRRHAGGDLEIEVAAELPAVEAAGPVDALLRVGGAAVGRVPLPRQKILGAHELRAELTQAGGFELCRVAVREAILGRPFTDPGSLRERLARAAPAPKPRAVTLGRPPGAPIGTSACRRAHLPAEALPELRDLAAAIGQPVLEIPGGRGVRLL